MLKVANGTSRCASGQCVPCPRLTDRMVKYIANSAAKNMSSEDNHTMVPTWTRFGRLDPCGLVVVVIADAVATPSIIAAPQVGSPHDPPLGSVRAIGTGMSWQEPRGCEPGSRAGSITMTIPRDSTVSV
ncbi:hypothetical protein Mame01_12000 [Microbispora amethystogenes]|nr:hypothetical protein Mame01_12000 [Microbispora amethystogenes]